MYNQIPEKYYSQKQQEFLEQISDLRFQDKQKYGHFAFNTIRQYLIFVINDYAAFIAHANKWRDMGNRMDSIHLGLRTAQEFFNLWDHIGFSLNAIFNLGLKKGNVNFVKAIDDLCSAAKNKNEDLREMSAELKNIYDSDVELRNKYRKKIVHRYHEVFFYDDLNESQEEKLERLEETLKESFDRLIQGLEKLRGIIDKFAPKNQPGLIPKDTS